MTEPHRTEPSLTVLETLERKTIAPPPPKSHEQLLEFLTNTKGINESVVLGRDGAIISYQSTHPVLKNALPFIVTKAKQAGAVFGFTGFRYVAMQRGAGKKLIILNSNDVLVGLEADASCLQQIVLETLRPLLNTDPMETM